MTTTPPEDGGTFGPPPEPPPSPGPWASDNLPPHPIASSTPVERPPSIRTAVNLMYVGAGLAVLRILVVLLLIGTIRDQIEDDNPNFSDSEVSASVTGVVAFSIVVALIAVGLWLWMAHENGAGKSWARTVATVLGVLSVVFTVLGLFTGNPMGVNLIALVDLVLAVAILVMLYRPESSAYYQARSRGF